jgi:voltage-gated potassium channel
VPTGIVTAEIARAASATPVTALACPACGLGAHEHDAVYCRKCGAKL